MKSKEEAHKIAVHFNRIIGQLRAIEKMMVKDKSAAADILIQLHAADAVLHNIAAEIVGDHLKKLLDSSKGKPDPEAVEKEFSNALKQFYLIR